MRYRYKTEPYSHQKKALKKLLNLDGKGGLLMEMGTGKTKVAIDWAGIGFYNFSVRKVLVVAPLSVLGVWPRQVRLHSGAPARTIRLAGSTKDRLSMLRRVIISPRDDLLTYLIINYEAIWRENDLGVSVEQLLIKWGPDLVIFDESHRLKNPTSKQSRSAYRIAQVTDHRLILTGTSITKSPLDVFGQFRSMDDQVFGNNWYKFRNRYAKWAGTGWTKHKLIGYRRLGELIKLVRDHSYRVKKEQCLDLPPKVFETVPIQLSPREEKFYKEMAKEAIIEIEEGVYSTARIVLTKLLRLRQITSGFAKDEEGNIRELGTSKLDACMDLLEDLVEEDHKVVVFGEFLHDIYSVSAKLQHKKIKHHILSGSVPPTRRDSIIEEFQTDPEYKVFVAQLATGSEGIELTAADAVIYFSLNHKAIYYWQSQDRVHRPGQTKKVTYYHLVVPKSVDEVVLRSLQEKKDIAETVLHKPRALLGF